MKKKIIGFLVCLLLSSACTLSIPMPAPPVVLDATSTAVPSAQTPTETTASTQTDEPVTATRTAADTQTSTPAFTFTHTATSTPTFTPTPTSTETPTVTPTPTITATPTITLTPTFDFPVAVVNQQAHCRYGPSKAYLHAADLYAGDTGTVRGRFQYSAWLYVKFDKFKYYCWVSPSVIDVSGDITRLYYTKPKLETIGSNMYGPPQDVYATREGNKVTITWNRLKMTVDDDRGYFIEAWVCQNGAYLWWTVSFADQYTTHYTVQDDAGCAQPSSGEIRSVEKHGYSAAVQILWIKP